MSSGSKCPKIGPGLCAYACAYVDPVLTSQSYDISIGTKHVRSSSGYAYAYVAGVSLAYTSAGAYAYALVQTRL